MSTVLAVGESTNPKTVPEQLQAIAERREAERGEERPCDPLAGPQNTDDEQPFRTDPGAWGSMAVMCELLIRRAGLK
jgi:hypothetical protein